MLADVGTPACCSDINTILVVDALWHQTKDSYAAHLPMMAPGSPNMGIGISCTTPQSSMLPARCLQKWAASSTRILILCLNLAAWRVY